MSNPRLLSHSHHAWDLRYNFEGIIAPYGSGESVRDPVSSTRVNLPFTPVRFTQLHWNGIVQGVDAEIIGPAPGEGDFGSIRRPLSRSRP